VTVARLITGVIVETHDEWAVAERRYLYEESMAKLITAVHLPAQDGAPHADRRLTQTVPRSTITTPSTFTPRRGTRPRAPWLRALRHRRRGGADLSAICPQSVRRRTKSSGH
jgi:hypothetical protein